MVSYDFGPKTSTGYVKKLLSAARTEGDIYVIARIVGILRHRGCTDVDLRSAERKKLLRALQTVRGGKKVLAHWLPIGYQTARLIWLTRKITGKNVVVTTRDTRRIKDAARYYRARDDKHARLQLRSLVATAKEIGMEI